MVLWWDNFVFVVAITTPGATLTLAGENSLLFFAGGLYAIVGSMILRTETLEETTYCTADPSQEKHQPKLTWQEKFRLVLPLSTVIYSF